MNRHSSLGLFLAIIYCQVVGATPTVNEWNVNDGTKWSFSILSPTRVAILILDTDADTFAFEAYDDSTFAPVDIDEIRVDSGVGGTVRVSVLQNPGNSPATTTGADDVRVIDLSNADTGELVSIGIGGDLGRIQFQPAGHVTVDAITGTLTFDSLYNSCSAGAVSGSLSMSQIISGSTFTASSLSGSLVASFGAGGDVTINSDLDGVIDFSGAATYGGTITINGDIPGTGQISVPRLDGQIIVTGDLVSSSSNRILVTGTTNNSVDYEAIHIGGNLTGNTASAPLIKVTGQVANTIGINGSMVNACTGNEIEVASLRTSSSPYGAITINYDGVSDVSDDWIGGSVLVGVTPYSANNPAARVWSVSRCVGDFNGDRAVNGSDPSIFSTWVGSPSTYYASYPGLEGSAAYHGNPDFNTASVTDLDTRRITSLAASTCCIYEVVTTHCPGDVDDDWDTDITDLATLLGNFGSTSASREDGDLDDDADVDISDLSLLLGSFGVPCCPSSIPSPLAGTVSISVSGFDTLGYSGGAFAGEKTHFVFDVFTTINDSDDDWTGSAAHLTTSNGATFRLVPSPGNPPEPTSSTPDKYATFFSVPYAVNANSRFYTPFPSGGIAGGSSTSTSYTYSTSTVDAAWYDIDTASNDGPAAVLRVVIDVSAVSGANVTGFGDVYFTTGSPGSGDIKVADMTFEVAHKYDDSGSTTISGSFYVTD
ncbi:MAG: hypothetical protein IT450_19590 [Phycisphaerales bacterium]|nr:hypothetical protein [Phycisphaerales bacterium]